MPHGPQSHSRWCILISPRTARLDIEGRAVLADVRQAGFCDVEAVHSSRIYMLGGQLGEAEVQQLASELLADPVTERFTIHPGLSLRPAEACSIEVHPLPGVMNPAAQSTLDAAQRVFAVKAPHARLEQVQTARRYALAGARSADELERIASKVLANDCIERWYIRGFGRDDALPDDFPQPPQRPFKLRHVAIRELSADELARLSRQGHLFLSLAEMQAVQAHYHRIGRNPTDLELETLAQTWSEHCVHKTLKSAIEYEGDDFGRPGRVRVSFNNLLKETIAAATHTLNRDWCLSVFVDNAGVVALDEEYGIAFKVETHNHPSAIEPYGGASTGVGGCIRDIMGCGLGAKPIASTDVFCLAPPMFEAARVPAGVLHPRRVLKGVVSGVRDYGNRMGIPTVNGAIYFDDRYLANPLVFCGCVGLIPRNRIHKKAHRGDYVVVAGGRTGRDGIHGATFSSAELTEQHADEFSHAVQIGNAIEEKKLLDAQLIARDHAAGCLYSAVTDCGAGGLSSAVGEMGAELGAQMDLEKVPLKYAGLRYDEIWISEAQERMVFAVPPDRLEKFLGVFAAEDVEATVIGRFTGDGVLRVRYAGTVVGELDMKFLHEGLPRATRKARWERERGIEATTDTESSDYQIAKPKTESWRSGRQPAVSRASLLGALRELNIASKEWVIRQYDHEVQGRSVIKPLVGPGFGPSDAAVLRPRYDSYRGIAIGCGLCPHWSQIDPYWMAVLAIDEALRNVICVGADPARTAILDNFCWPKCDSEESLGALVRACVGARDAAIAYGLPFISGKDSLNNEFSMSIEESRRTGLPQRLAIPPTLLISALGMVPDVRRCVSMDLKEPGNVLVMPNADVMELGLDRAAELHRQVAGLIRDGKVRAAHDVSDGGLAVAVAEMCIGSELGAELSMISGRAGNRLSVDSVFGETATTYLLEMAEADARSSGFPVIGRVSQARRLRIETGSGEGIEVPVAELADAWREPLTHGGVRTA
jgi:phosphoribosylformylglycinamidine synthase